jgi:hypothetical protein
MQQETNSEVSMSSEVIEKRLYSLPDSSVRLGNVSVYSLRRHIEAGNIRAVHVGGRVLIPVSELERVEQFGVGQPRTRRNDGQ